MLWSLSFWKKLCFMSLMPHFHWMIWNWSMWFIVGHGTDPYHTIPGAPSVVFPQDNGMVKAELLASHNTVQWLGDRKLLATMFGIWVQLRLPCESPIYSANTLLMPEYKIAHPKCTDWPLSIYGNEVQQTFFLDLSVCSFHLSLLTSFTAPYSMM